MLSLFNIWSNKHNDICGSCKSDFSFSMVICTIYRLYTACTALWIQDVYMDEINRIESFAEYTVYDALLNEESTPGEEMHVEVD